MQFTQGRRRFGRCAGVILCASIFGLSACAPPPQDQAAPVETDQVDAEAITAIIREVGNALSAGDLDRWASSFTDDVVIMRPDTPSAVGLEANKDIIQGVFDQYTLDIDFVTDEVVVAGEWAFARATYAETITPKTGGEPEHVYGKQLNILRRQPDGSWKIARRIHNRNPSPSGSGH